MTRAQPLHLSSSETSHPDPNINMEGIEHHSISWQSSGESVIDSQDEPSKSIREVRYITLENEDFDKKDAKVKRSSLNQNKKEKTHEKPLPPLELSHGVCSSKKLIRQRSCGDSLSETSSESNAMEEQLMDIFQYEHKKRVRFQEALSPEGKAKRTQRLKRYIGKSLHRIVSCGFKTNSSRSKDEASAVDSDLLQSVVTTLNKNTVSDYPEATYTDFLAPSDEQSPISFTSKTITGEKTRRSSLSQLDAATIKSLKRNVKKGDFLYKAKKYELAIDAYRNAYYTLTTCALEFSKQTVTKLLKRLNDVHNTIAMIKNSAFILKLGVQMENKHEYIRALKYYTIAFRLRRCAMGRNHISLVIILQMLAEVQAKRQEYSESLEIYKMANIINKEQNPHGINPKSLLPSICLEEYPNLFLPPPDHIMFRGEGVAHENLNNLSHALELYHQSLRLSTQQHEIQSQPPRSPTGVAEFSNANDIRNNPALQSETSCFTNNEYPTPIIEDEFDFNKVQLHLSCDSYENLEVIYEPVSMYNRSLTKDDLETAITLSHIGHVQRRLGNSNIALQAYRGALHGMKLSLGENHPNVAALLGNIGNIYKEMGDHDLAIQIYKDVLRIESQTLGSNHAEITVTMHNMGTIECCRRNFDIAVKLFSRAMAIQNKRYGRNHAVVAVTSNSLGEAYEKMKDADKALKMYRESLRISTKHLGHNHTDVTRLLYKIGSVHRDCGRKEYALKYFRKALDIHHRHSKFKDVGKLEKEKNSLIVQIEREIADLCVGDILASPTTTTTYIEV